jgi:antitoxin component HigA of HigAB toxin-antitoxin module
MPGGDDSGPPVLLKPAQGMGAFPIADLDLANATISEILAEKRKLNLKHIRALARFF